jgi:lysophospholipase L1-like esterase/D-alanyl-lipoteichoic acid acyltransferase DltB (MBOAT superfamily)
MATPGRTAVRVGVPRAQQRGPREAIVLSERGAFWPWAAQLWKDAPRLTWVAIELALVVLVLRFWRIDGVAFRLQFSIVCVGFVVHHLLPMKLRLPCFVVLSLVGIVTLLDPANSLLLVGLGLVLIGVASTPVGLAARVGLLVAIGAALAAVRQSSSMPAMTGLWPILGSMFMFRMMVYLHDRHTGIAPGGFWRSLAYFFMLPNAYFPLFPLVDYKTFTRTYYNRDAVGIYQKGVDWIMRGVVQLILYRFVYQILVMDPEHVASAGDLAHYLVANFLLYLRVSGNFHLIIGMLHLFGFNLPETHHRYLLSSSFTDFWRRINIYWKDFIQKMFFFPLYFRLKGRGEMTAIALATVLAFVATWALHSYQWFWLRGSVLFTWQDISFWTILALGVLVNVLYEARNTRRRAAAKLSTSWRSELARAFKTIAMFSFICLLWSLWNARSLEGWLTMLSQARHITWTSAAAIVAGLALLGVAAVTMGRSSSERTDAPMQPGHKRPARPFWISVAKTVAVALLLAVVGRNPLWFESMPRVADVLDRLTTNQLNAQDTATLERGYYEDLTGEAQFSLELAELYKTMPAEWEDLRGTSEFGEKKFPEGHYAPLVRRKLSDGSMLSTNRWGIRDQDYEKQKPAGVYRMVLLGDSLTFGYGVGDDAVFEAIVEKRLNEQKAGAAYELINFASKGYGPYGRLQYLRLKALEFEPDAVLSIAVNDVEWMLRDVSRCVTNGLEIPDPFINEIVAKAGLSTGMGRRIVERRLQPYIYDLIKWDYEQIAQLSFEHGARPYAVFLPRLNDRTWETTQLPKLKQIAEEAGFTVVDLTGAYESVEDWKTLWRRTWDVHPNVRGHQLIAELFYENFEPLLVPPPPPLKHEEAAP